MKNPTSPTPPREEAPARRRARPPWRIVRALVWRLLVQVAIDCLRDLW